MTEEQAADVVLLLSILVGTGFTVCGLLGWIIGRRR